MTDHTLPNGRTGVDASFPSVLRAVLYRLEVHARLARRRRYRVAIGRGRKRYPWFETMIQAMSAR